MRADRLVNVKSKAKSNGHEGVPCAPGTIVPSAPTMPTMAAPVASSTVAFRRNDRRAVGLGGLLAGVYMRKIVDPRAVIRLRCIRSVINTPKKFQQLVIDRRVRCGRLLRVIGQPHAGAGRQ